MIFPLLLLRGGGGEAGKGGAGKGTAPRTLLLLTRCEIERGPPHVDRLAHTEPRVAHQVEKITIPNLKKSKTSNRYNIIQTAVLYGFASRCSNIIKVRVCLHWRWQYCANKRGRHKLVEMSQRTRKSSLFLQQEGLLMYISYVYLYIYI